MLILTAVRGLANLRNGSALGGGREEAGGGRRRQGKGEPQRQQKMLQFSPESTFLFPPWALQFNAGLHYAI